MPKFIQDRVARVPSQNIRSTGGYAFEVLAGPKGLDTTSPQFQLLDPDGGNVDLYLPPVDLSTGAWFRVGNVGGALGTLEIKTDPAAPAILALPNNAGVFLVCDGFSWAPSP